MLHRRKKEPVLTGKTCLKMELFRLAVEVLLGKRVAFENMDFNTGGGRLFVGAEQSMGVMLCMNTDTMTTFKLEGDSDMYYARLTSKPRVVRVINQTHPRRIGQHSVWFVGSSTSDRWDEPVEPHVVASRARYYGLSVYDYLHDQELNPDT